MKENIMENRLQNLLWTVSEDYNCDVKINPADMQKYGFARRFPKIF